jgi:putative ABC transport system permease protein
MSLWRIAWAYLWNRTVPTLLTILSVALAVALISSVLTLREETRKRFEEEGQAFDLVVGAKGSPLQLVLSSVYFMDQPTGNIPLSEYERLKNDSEYVEAAFPIAMGDSYGGFRIVGTTPDLFDHTWESPSTGALRHPFALAEGERFDQPMEAVIGAVVARQTGLQVGDDFISVHGMIELPEGLREHDHSDMPYIVTGIMAPSNSPYDRAIFCSVDSVWQAHGGHAHGDEAGHDDHAHDDHDHDHAHDDHDHDHDHAHDDPNHDHAHEEAAATTAEQYDAVLNRDASTMVTAVLVQLKSPALRFQYQEIVRETTNVMAAIPIQEIAKLFDQFLETIKTILLAVGYLVVVISALSILIGLYLSIVQRKRDLAIMRALGASAYEIFGAVLIEALLVTLLGIGFGWLLGNVVTYVLGQYLAQTYGLVITPFGITREEINAFATVALMGLLAGVLPAWQAYDSDVARDLADR